MPTLSEMSIEQQHLLRTAAANLATQFEGTYRRPTIEEFLASSYEQFAGQATVAQMLIGSDEMAEGLAAFLEKRQPFWVLPN